MYGREVNHYELEISYAQPQYYYPRFTDQF